MNILGALKKKYDEVMKQIHRDTRIRHQLNMNVDLRLKTYLQGLAKELGVPRDIVGEHALEIGINYIGRVLRSGKLTGILRHHLINEHLLDSGFDDAEDILRLGEGGGSVSLWLAHVRPVLEAWRAFEQAAKAAIKTGNFDTYKRHEKRLLRFVILFCEWLEKTCADMEENVGTDNGQEGAQEDEEEGDGDHDDEEDDDDDDDDG